MHVIQLAIWFVSFSQIIQNYSLHHTHAHINALKIDNKLPAAKQKMYTIHTFDIVSRTHAHIHPLMLICGHVTHLSMQMICFTFRSDIFQAFKSHNILLLWHWNSVASMFFHFFFFFLLACLFVRFGLNWILFFVFWNRFDWCQLKRKQHGYWHHVSGSETKKEERGWKYTLFF